MVHVYYGHSVQYGSWVAHYLTWLCGEFLKKNVYCGHSGRLPHVTTWGKYIV